jgi:hypothetical protein
LSRNELKLLDKHLSQKLSEYIKTLKSVL